MYDNIAKPSRGFFVYHRNGDKRFLSTGTKLSWSHYTFAWGMAINFNKLFNFCCLRMNENDWRITFFHYELVLIDLLSW